MPNPEERVEVEERVEAEAGAEPAPPPHVGKAQLQS